MAEFEAYTLGQKESYDASIDEVEALRKNHEKLTAELLDEYVEDIEVHPGNEVRINWK